MLQPAVRTHRSDAELDCSANQPLDRYDFGLFLVLGNVGALRDLMKSVTTKRGNPVVKEGDYVEQQLQQVWLDRWEDVAPIGGDHPTLGQVERVLQDAISGDRIWVRNARSMLFKQRLIRNEHGTEVGTLWQVTDFLCDIAGYDLLRT